MDVNILTCVRVKGGGNESSRIDSGMKRGYVISSLLFNVYMYAAMKEVVVG